MAVRTSVDDAIREFYTQAIEMQNLCSEQMGKVLEALHTKEDAGLLAEKKDHLELIIRLSSQISDTYQRTAEQLSQLQNLSNQGKLADIRSFLDLNFFIKEKQFDLIQKEMKAIQDENGRLREENRVLRQDSVDQVSRLAHTVRISVLEAWRRPVQGLNIEGLCKNSECEASGRRVIVPVGLGRHEVATLVFNATCPLCNEPVEEANRVYFERCVFSYTGNTKDKETVTKVNEVARDLQGLNIADWMKGQITASPIAEEEKKGV